MTTTPWDIEIAHFLLSGGEILQEKNIESAYNTTSPDKIQKTQESQFTKFPKLRKLYDLIELPVKDILTSMHETGIHIDRVRLAEVEETFSKKRAELQDKITSQLGPINLNSPKQLGAALVDTLKITLPKTKTGQYATGVDVLEGLATQHDVVKDIMDFRIVDKLLNTYIAPLAGFISADGRIHPWYSQTSAPTGRLAARDPNIQSTPVTGEYGLMVRSCYTSPPGSMLVGADYSQQELRILAHLSQDKKLAEAFEQHIDVHIATASEILELPIDKIGKKERAIGKVLNFGIVYGETAYGLSRQLGKPPQECQAILKKYFETYSGVKKYFDNLLTGAKIHGRVETLYGRVRSVPFKRLDEPVKFLTGEQERILKNFPIQGSAADMTKTAMVKLARDVLPKYPKARLIMQIHDELICEYSSEDTAEVEEFRHAFAHCLETAVKLSVPVVVSSSVGRKWSELK